MRRIKAPMSPPAVPASGWYRELFRIDSTRISILLFVRVAIAVGIPMFGFVLAGHHFAAIASGATALFVTLSDVGPTPRERSVTMVLATILILLGGFIGDKFGGTTWADEFFILASAFVAGWVSNSHPEISAVARFSALATAAGAGMQVDDALAAIAVLAGGASAIGVAWAIRFADDAPPDQNFMDWRAGIRRAFAGADAGLWFAFCFAAACALALLAARWLGVASPYWATFVVVMVMRHEGTVSIKLVILYMLGTIAGVPVASALAELAGGNSLALVALATMAAACGRLGFALNAAIGYLAFTVFLVVIIELVRGGAVPPSALVLTRLYDVGVGCAIALVATLVAGLGQRGPQPESTG
jgi:Fusaric acid resistance protein-like